MIYSLAVFMTVLFTLASSLDYIRRMWRRDGTQPRLATWILMMVVIVLSTVMYCHSPRMSWKGNIAVFSALANIASILTSLLVLKWRKGELLVEFDWVQKLCLIGGTLTVLFWVLTKDPFRAYIMVQAIAIIAYCPTVVKLWNASSSSEPASSWALVLAACVSAAYPALVDHDKFAYAFLIRAIPSTAFMVCLILRIKSRMVGKTFWQFVGDGFNRVFRSLVTNV